jgi:hypothetical protein
MNAIFKGVLTGVIFFATIIISGQLAEIQHELKGIKVAIENIHHEELPMDSLKK